MLGLSAYLQVLFNLSARTRARCLLAGCDSYTCLQHVCRDANGAPSPRLRDFRTWDASRSLWVLYFLRSQQPAHPPFFDNFENIIIIIIIRILKT